jgi:hypothetical protein
MAEHKDSVKDQTESTGTGSITLSGIAPAGFRTVVSAHTSGATISYRINSSDQSQWEVGQGVLTGSTLSRATVFASSNADALVNFSAGVKSVITTLVADDLTKESLGVTVGLERSFLLMGA